MSSDIDALVDLVAQRVRERLAAQAAGAPSTVRAQAQLPVSVLRDMPCTANAEQCNGDGLCARRRPDDVRKLRDTGAVRVGASGGIGDVATDLARMIDHTLLKPEATREEVRVLCEEARKHHFATVCVNSVNVRYAAQLLAGSDVLPIAVVGFPLGASLPAAKAFEAREAVRNGAREIDMVINVGALKSQDYQTVLDDIEAVVKASQPYPVKVILETSLLTDEEKVVACTLAKAAGAAFVKTSTGFGKGGATVHDIGLMRRVVGGDMGVKASGGIRTREDADAMRAAGADRIGASASVAIVLNKKSAKSGY